MRPLGLLLVYILSVFAGGALAAPAIFWLVQSLAPASPLAENPFHRFVERALMAIALLGIWPLLRALGADSWSAVGVVAPAGQKSRLAGGFLLGFGSLALLAGLALAGHAREFKANLTVTGLGVNILAAAGTATVVAGIEELLFRGVIFGTLRRVFNWRGALLLSSMIYALVHFLQKPHLVGPVTWLSGLELLPQMLRGFGQWPVLIPGFFNLTLVGMLLGLAYQRTGNLYFSLGLHGGWVFWLRFHGYLTRPTAGAAVTWFGSDKLIDGWLAMLVLGLTGVLLVWRLPAKSREAAGE